MAIINTGATTLADIANLTQDSDLQKKVLIQTIRDYSGFFDQLTLIPANDGTACKGSIVTDYPEGEVVGYNEGWGTSQAKGVQSDTIPSVSAPLLKLTLIFLILVSLKSAIHSACVRTPQ